MSSSANAGSLGSASLAASRAAAPSAVTKKINLELIRMTIVVVGLCGLGIYAWQFVYEGIMAKAALNLSIVGIFMLAVAICYVNTLNMYNEKRALDALRADFGDVRHGEEIVDTPAVVFKKPKLLGYGYRLVTEELLARAKGQIPTETIHLLVKEVDHRISDAKATMGYFGGLLVFMGLLGAFMGLMKTVSSVGELIGSMDVSGAGGADQMGAMIEGMKKPLHGMSVGFSSSLFGLLFSMTVGVLDRFMAGAMKAVRNDFEACLIDLAHLEMAHDANAQAKSAEAHGERANNVMDAQNLTDAMKQGLRAQAYTCEQINAMSANLQALSESIRQVVLQDARNELGQGLVAIAQSQKALADEIRLMREDARLQQERLVRALESGGRFARPIPAPVAASVQVAAEGEDLAPAVLATHMAPKPTGARALLSMLTRAFGGEESVYVSRRGTMGERDLYQMANAVGVMKTLSREVIERIDEEASQTQEASLQADVRNRMIADQIDILTRRLDDMAARGEFVGNARLEEIRTQLEASKAQVDTSMERIAAQVNAGLRHSERAERAAVQAARLAASLQAQRPKAVGE
jgi:hypothetical protein